MDWCENMKQEDFGFLDMLAQCSKTFLPPDATHVNIHDLRLFSCHGVSSTMYAFLLSYSLQGLNHNDSLVLRVYNKGFEIDGLKEYKLLKDLKESYMPVPNAYLFEPNNQVSKKAFMIMEKIDGVSASVFLNNDTFALTTIDKMAEALNKIHKINPRSLRDFDALQKQYVLDQERLLKIIAWIKKMPISFFSLLTSYQKRLISVVKKLEKLKLEEFRPAILHYDYEPNHALLVNGECIIIDWHMAVVGDPSFDVANTYHELELLENNCKVNLGDYFVQCYEKHSGQRLANLQFNKTMSALRFASWFLLFPFEPNAFSVFTSLAKNSLLIGKVGYNLRKRYRQHLLNQQHSSGQKPLEYFQNYVVRSLENAVH
jgi:aminoglycoside phosphotransferase (APT) family kinase protein